MRWKTDRVAVFLWNSHSKSHHIMQFLTISNSNGYAQLMNLCMTFVTEIGIHAPFKTPWNGWNKCGCQLIELFIFFALSRDFTYTHTRTVYTAVAHATKLLPSNDNSATKMNEKSPFEHKLTLSTHASSWSIYLSLVQLLHCCCRHCRHSFPNAMLFAIAIVVACCCSFQCIFLLWFNVFTCARYIPALSGWITARCIFPQSQQHAHVQ